MPSDWTATTLGECADFFSGGTPRKSNATYWGGNVPWFSGKDLKSFYLNDSEDHVTEIGAQDGSRLMPADTILLLVRGMMLHNDVPIGVLTREATFNQDIKALRAKDGVQQSFLAHWLVSQKPRLLQTVHAAGHGTGVLATDRLQALELEMPPPEEQAAIANVFDLIEAKIEQNRRTGRKLEELAQATFKAWFVDFEPVHAKAAGSTAFPGMRDETFAALPSHFVDSQLGPVPQGWEVVSLLKMATFLNGLALQKFPATGQPSDLPVIKIAELRKGSSAGADRASSQVPSQYVIDDGELLFSWSGTLEARIWYGGRGALNQHVFKVTSQRFPKWFCLQWVLHHLPEFRAIASSKATTMGHIQRKHLEAAKVIIPQNALLLAASSALSPLYELIERLHIESRKLICMRDYLLPKLLSGDARVRLRGQ